MFKIFVYVLVFSSGGDGGRSVHSQVIAFDSKSEAEIAVLNIRRIPASPYREIRATQLF